MALQTGSPRAQSYAKITATRKGKESASVQPVWPISNDGFGLLESTCKFTMSTDSSASMPQKGSVHPHDGRLKCYKCTSTTRIGGLLDVEASYVGIESGSYTDKQVTMTVGTSTEPIDCHPNFVKKIGGKPSKPLNSAIFIDPITHEATEDDTNGVFSEFNLMETSIKGWEELGKQLTGKKNRMAGVKSYYSPTVTLKGVFYTDSNIIAEKVVGALGKCTDDGVAKGVELIPSFVNQTLITLKDNSKVEGRYQDRNWLCTGAGVEQYGHILKVTYDLTLGGPLGWEADIYDSVPKD